MLALIAGAGSSTPALWARSPAGPRGQRVPRRDWLPLNVGQGARPSGLCRFQMKTSPTLDAPPLNVAATTQVPVPTPTTVGAAVKAPGWWPYVPRTEILRS